MTDPNELARTLVALGAALDGLGVRWAIGGSLASATHGEPRATNDIDVIALLNQDTARALCAALAGEFYADVDTALEAVRARRSFNVIDKTTFFKVDIFVPGPGPLGAGQLDRCRVMDVHLGARPFPVLSAEDIVLQKLRWYAVGGEVSDKQWRDILSVLRFAGDDMDQSYVDTVAQVSGLGDLLARARKDAR